MSVPPCAERREGRPINADHFVGVVGLAACFVPRLAPTTTVLGEPASPPFVVSKGVVSWRYSAIRHQPKPRRVADSPTTHRPQISDRPRARNRGKPPDGSEGFTEANVNITVYAHVECRAQSRQVDP